MFMLDFLTRKVALDMQEIRALPDVLRAWVRFALAAARLDDRGPR
jgi:hypothetical protein